MTLYERYITGDNADGDIFGVTWRAQTFTIGNTGTNEGHNVTSVKLKLLRLGSPGEITVTINEAVDDLPTDVILATGTTTGNDLPTGFPYEWREITFETPAALSASTQYAIVVSATGGDASNLVRWRFDAAAAEYTGGEHSLSSDSGDSWAAYTDYDLMFEEYGVPVKKRRGQIVKIGLHLRPNI